MAHHPSMRNEPRGMQPQAATASTGLVVGNHMAAHEASAGHGTGLLASSWLQQFLVVAPRHEQYKTLQQLHHYTVLQGMLVCKLFHVQAAQPPQQRSLKSLLVRPSEPVGMYKAEK